MRAEGVPASEPTEVRVLFNADNLYIGVFCFDSEPGRRPLYHRLVGSGELPAGYAADDGAALVFAGTELREVVSSRPGAAAYRVERQGDAAVETRLPVRELPAG